MCRSSLVRPALIAALLVAPVALAQDDLGPVDECKVSVLNQTVPVAKDGSWRLPNLATSGGYIRVQLICKGPLGIKRGQSKFFTLTRNRMNAIAPIAFGVIQPRPAKIEVLPDEHIQTRFKTM